MKPRFETSKVLFAILLTLSTISFYPILEASSETTDPALIHTVLPKWTGPDLACIASASGHTLVDLDCTNLNLSTACSIEFEIARQLALKQKKKFKKKSKKFNKQALNLSGVSKKQIKRKAKKNNKKSKDAKRVVEDIDDCELSRLFPAIPQAFTSGSGTSNDGAGIYDLKHPVIFFSDRGRTIRFHAAPDLTNLVGMGMGDIDIWGRAKKGFGKKDTDTYEVKGLFRAFNGAQDEEFKGKLEIDFSKLPDLTVTINGTNSGQSAQFAVFGIFSFYQPPGEDTDGDFDFDFADFDFLETCFGKGDAAPSGCDDIPEELSFIFQSDLNELNELDIFTDGFQSGDVSSWSRGE